MSASLWQAPLAEFQTEVAKAQPAPAGVAVACVNATLAVSLLVKVLRITGKCPELLAPALRLIEELRSAADADVEAVRTYMKTRDKQAMDDIPARAALAAAEASALCAEAARSVTGLISADIGAASALLRGATIAITTCMSANQA
jgi:formiminotetrahydrofolate cyclodeaminase